MPFQVSGHDVVLLYIRTIKIEIKECENTNSVMFLFFLCYCSLCNVLLLLADYLIMIGLTCPVVLFLEIVLVYYFGPSMIHSHILCLKVSVDVLQESTKTATQFGKVSSLEHLLALVIPHIGQKPCTCQILIHNGVFHPRFLQFLSYGSFSCT